MVSNSKENKKGKLGYKETLFSALVVLLFIALIVFLISANLRMNKRRTQYIDRIELLKDEIKELEQEREKLDSETSEVESQANLEKVAREQFGMKSPGEEVVVISKEGEEEKTEQKEKKKSFFEGWWDWLMGRNN